MKLGSATQDGTCVCRIADWPTRMPKHSWMPAQKSDQELHPHTAQMKVPGFNPHSTSYGHDLGLHKFFDELF
jgi:hypothetical protein